MMYAFTTGEQLLSLCTQYCLPIYGIMLLREQELFGRSEDMSRAQMREVWAVMERAATQGIEQTNISMGGLAGDEAKKLYHNPNPLLGQTATRAAAIAMAIGEVSASMGRIVASPTAGSSGVLPGVLAQRSYDEQTIVNALFTASAVGLLIQTNASVSGAECGCQAEIGAASAMAAAALVEIHSGSPAFALSAAANALQNLMGLVCDPVAGLVEIPCIKRNGIGAINAMLCADMALSGITTLIPFDQTVSALYEVGQSLPRSLRESAQGGIANTPCAKDLEKHIFEKEPVFLNDLGR